MNTPELPPLPDPAVIDTHIPTKIALYGYNRQQMHAYAESARAPMVAEVEMLRARVAELEAERIGVFSELQADRLKLGAFRNRLVSELAQASSGPFEYRRAVAESAVEEFETAFNAAMQARGTEQKERGNG